MVGHYCLPSIAADGEKDKPAILCKSLITDLLKGKLGFKGCVVSDAMSMVGACAYSDSEQDFPCSLCKRAATWCFFFESTDLDNMVEAVECGDKVLVVVMAEAYWHDEATAKPYLPLKQTFELFGCPTDILVNVKHKKTQSVMNDYAVVLVVCDFLLVISATFVNQNVAKICIRM